MEVGISVDRPDAFVTDASMWISVDASVWMLVLLSCAVLVYNK
jgi:hypothetical protein